jgi:hypothetical protein
LWTGGVKGGWPKAGEIDILEYWAPKNTTNTALHFSLNGKHAGTGGEVEIENPWDDFHVYAVEWNSKQMDFSVDGVCYFTFDVAKADDHGFNPYRQPHSLLLSLGLVGDKGWLDPSTLPHKFIVDYVRVYQPAGAGAETVKADTDPTVDIAKNLGGKCLAQDADGSVTLPSAEAVCSGKEIACEGGQQKNIGRWWNVDDFVQWKFAVKKPGTFTLSAELASEQPSVIEVVVGAKKLDVPVAATGGYGKYKKIDLGTIEIPAGNVLLELRAHKDDWHPVNVRTLHLKPVKPGA